MNLVLKRRDRIVVFGGKRRNTVIRRVRYDPRIGVAFVIESGSVDDNVIVECALSDICAAALNRDVLGISDDAHHGVCAILQMAQRIRGLGFVGYFNGIADPRTGMIGLGRLDQTLRIIFRKSAFEKLRIVHPAFFRIRHNFRDVLLFASLRDNVHRIGTGSGVSSVDVRKLRQIGIFESVVRLQMKIRQLCLFEINPGSLFHTRRGRLESGEEGDSESDDRCDIDKPQMGLFHFADNIFINRLH